MSFNLVEQREFTLHAISGVHSAEKVRPQGGWERSWRRWTVLVKREESTGGMPEGTTGPEDGGARNTAGEVGLYRKPSRQTLGWWWKVPFMWSPACLARAGEATERHPAGPDTRLWRFSQNNFRG